MTLAEFFRDVLSKHKRVAICGAPKTGKSTLSEMATDRKTIHSDDFINLGWSEASEHIVRTLNDFDGAFCVEGVAVARALRKGLIVDAVVWLPTPHVPLSKGQETMRKAVKTVFQEWRDANPDVKVFIHDEE